MKNNKEIICNQFERDVFLFREGSLPGNRMNLISNHLESCSACQSILNEAANVSDMYDSLSKEDVADYVFNSMIRRAAESKSGTAEYIQKKKSLVDVFGFYRLSFGGAAFIAAMILIIISFLKEPLLKKSVPAELLDWNGNNITNKIERIESQIISLKSDEWDIYIIRKNEKENWDATLKSIRNQIDKMKESTIKKEL